jgi:hypothetical protein
MLAPIRTLTALIYEHRNAAMCTLLVEDRLVFDHSDEDTGMEGLEGSVESRIIAEFQNKDRSDLFLSKEIERRSASTKALRIRAFRLGGKTWKPFASTFRKSDNDGDVEAGTFSASTSAVKHALSFLQWRQSLEPNISFFFEQPGADFPELVNDVEFDADTVEIEGPSEPSALSQPHQSLAGRGPEPSKSGG